MEFITHRRHAVNVSKNERTGSAIAGAALLGAGLYKRGAGGYLLAALGGELLRRGITGHCYTYQALGIRTAPLGQGAATTSVPYELGIRVDKSITVNRPVEEVYRFWRDFENLPRFMHHLQSVKKLDDLRSRWVAKGPGDKEVSWEAEIVNERENDLIGWRSLPGSDVDHSGSVHFSPAPDNRGTEVKVELQYNPPGGAVGALVAKLFGREPGDEIQSDLHRLKQMLETGEVPTVQGQTSGREAKKEEPGKTETHEVQYASEMSFPASDSPSYGR